jgi:hypothetical protein
MQTVFKLFVVLGSILSLFGMYLIFLFYRDGESYVYNNGLNVSLWMLFWYILPIISLVLIFGEKKWKIKYLGLLYMAIWTFTLGCKLIEENR